MQLKLSKEQTDFLKKFANTGGNLKYRYMVIYDMPWDWKNEPCQRYTDAQDYIENHMHKDAKHPQIINLLDYWEP